MYQDALTSYEALKRRKAFETEDQGQYGLALFRLGRDEEALKFAAHEAVTTDSTNCDAYFSLGSIYMKKRDYVKAAEMFDKRIACDPKSISLAAYLNAAASHMQNKNYVRTRELLTKTIELKPDFLPARLWLARYYTQVDSLENAQGPSMTRCCDKSGRTSRSTNVKQPKHTTCWACTTSGNSSSDLPSESFRRASSFGYDDASMRLTWGQAVLQTLDRQGDQEANDVKIQESIRHFRRVADLEPGNAQGHLWLAQGLIQSRKEGEDKKNQEIKEEACNELRKALKYEPRNEDAKKAMERIGCPGAK